jgi:hypothetical protein
VTSQFPPFVFRRSSAFLRIVHLMVLATILTAVLHTGSRVAFRSFLNPRLCFSRLSRAGGSLLRSEIVIFLVHSLCAEALEEVLLLAALSASSLELIWILGEINSVARLWNSSKPVNLATGSERFQFIIWSSKWKRLVGEYRR